MEMPNLRVICMDYMETFPDQTTPELDQTEQNFQDVMNSMKEAHNIPTEDFNEIVNANLEEHCEAQYLGFIQGVKWAVYLFTGHTIKKEGATV